MKAKLHNWAVLGYVGGGGVIVGAIAPRTIDLLVAVVVAGAAGVTHLASRARR